jgi:anti-sigma factor RsiW
MKTERSVRHTRRARTDKGNVRCNIDDETIELHAMGRLEDATLRKHLDTCTRCQERVVEHQAIVAALRQALDNFENGD